MANAVAEATPGCAIRVRGLRKQYRGVTAVDGIDLEIDRGEVFALLGPNGAGKTTTIEILEGNRRRDAGEISVLGADPARAGDHAGDDRLLPARPGKWNINECRRRDTSRIRRPGRGILFVE